VDEDERTRPTRRRRARSRAPSVRNQGPWEATSARSRAAGTTCGEFRCLRKGGEKCFAVAGGEPVSLASWEADRVSSSTPRIPATGACRVPLLRCGSRGPKGLAGPFPVEPVPTFCPSSDVHRKTVLAPGKIVHHESAAARPRACAARTARCGHGHRGDFAPGSGISAGHPVHPTAVAAEARAVLSGPQRPYPAVQRDRGGHKRQEARCRCHRQGGGGLDEERAAARRERLQAPALRGMIRGGTCGASERGSGQAASES